MRDTPSVPRDRLICDPLHGAVYIHLGDRHRALPGVRDGLAMLDWAGGLVRGEETAMLVRKFDLTTDRLGALAVLQAGIQEQRLAARRFQPEHQGSRRIDFGAAADEFVDPETWYVAVEGQQIVGVLQIMSEADPRERLYKSHRLLLIQELDAHPKRRGAGTALLEAAKREALRRGRTAIVLQTPTGGDAHTAWYPSRGFRPWSEGDHRQMSGMILHLGVE